MIGVIANPDEHPVVSEFFELFKTPWEFYRSERRYEVLLSTTGDILEKDIAKLILVYGGQKTPFDAEQGIEITAQKETGSVLSYKGTRIPIYGKSATFRVGQTSVLADEESQLPAVDLRRSRGNLLVRVGYNLFSEIAALLTAGQPIPNAGTPALDLHIAFLRDLIIGSGTPLVEIPPIPDGYRFIACLTHDVDHPSVRNHKFDHTMFGFLYRAILGSLFDVVRGRSSFGKLLTNWQAAIKLAFVHLGLAKDFWRGFDDYLKLEKGLGSSFFIIPFKDHAGRNAKGQAPSRRASSYGAGDISGDIQKLISADCEVGLHGLDAWIDSSRGQMERDEIRRVTGNQEIGIRMHWLYFDEQSPEILEKAGFQYDSTMGYNATVGYRAGTTQVYKPLKVSRLLELPLHIMDTALFYPSYLNLSSTEARTRVHGILDNAVEFGGTVTINWHDRSMAPERLWGDFYGDLVGALKDREAWFSTASQAVTWFRKRRAVVFENVSWESGGLHVQVPSEIGEHLPGLRLRIYNSPESGQANTRVRDVCLKQSMDVCVAVPATNGKN